MMKILELSQKKSLKLVNTIDFVTNDQMIRSDFDIFEFKKNKSDDNQKKYINFPFEKLSKIQKCAVADQYFSVFLIAVKNMTNLEYLQSLEINDYEVSVIDIKDLKKHRASLVNLFLNLYGSKILPQTKISESTSSIYGDFFYPVGKSDDPYNRHVLKLKYYKGLDITVQSFKKKIDNRKVKYFWDDNSLVPSRIYNSKDKINDYWIKGGRSGEKNLITFLSLNSFKEYKNSKIGVLYTIIDDFNKNLGKYIKFHLYEMSEDEEIVYQLSSNKQLFLGSAIKYFDGKKINIVDYINEDKSVQFVEKIILMLNQEINNLDITRSNNLKKGINISITKDPEYYLRNDKNDPYKSFSKKVIVQNITEDNLEIKKESSLIKNPICLKILQELMVKDSIGKNKINFNFISKEKINTKYKFVTFHRYYFANSYKDYAVTSQFDNDGNIIFGLEKSEDFFNKESALAKNLADLGIEEKSKSKVECIFYDDVRNPNVILNIGIYEIPRMETISERLRLADGRKKPYVKRLINDLELFENQYSEYKNNVDLKNVMQLLLEFDEEKISLNEYRQLLSKCNITGRKKIGKAYTDFLIRLNSSYIAFSNHKGRDFKEDYSPLYWTHFFRRISGIDKTVYARGNEVPVNHEFYSVAEGTSSIKQTYEKGYPIRRIINKGFRFSEEYNKSLSEMFDVDFVRINQATVVPFPVKFNREYFNMMKKEFIKK